jgi:hypothetical protein
MEESFPYNLDSEYEQNYQKSWQVQRRNKVESFLSREFADVVEHEDVDARRRAIDRLYQDAYYQGISLDATNQLYLMALNRMVRYRTEDDKILYQTVRDSNHKIHFIQVWPSPISRE